MSDTTPLPPGKSSKNTPQSVPVLDESGALQIRRESVSSRPADDEIIIIRVVFRKYIKWYDIKTADEIRRNAKKQTLNRFVKATIALKQEVIEWETQMVLDGKLHWRYVNRHVLDHPVVKQRIAFNKILHNQQKNKLVKKPKRKNLQVLETAQKIYCEELKTVADKSGVSSNDPTSYELPFGTSIVCDYRKHGANLEKIMFPDDTNNSIF